MDIEVLKKRWLMPRNGQGFSCKEFVMRELSGEDELEAAKWADKRRSEADTGALAVMNSEQREAIRLSLVSVDGEPVGGDIPYMAIDKWNLRTMRLVRHAFNDLNGVGESDLEDFKEAAEVVG